METQTEITFETVRPYNELTGADYSIGNALELFEVQLEQEYPTGQWAGFKQWRQLGRTVRKGEKATRVSLLVDDKRKKPVKGKYPKKLLILCVFNVAQTEPLQ